MRNARWNDYDIAAVNLLRNAARPAELYRCRSTETTEDFMCRAVIVMERVNAIDPTAAPAIGREKLLEDRLRIARGQLQSTFIDQQRQAAVWNHAVVLQQKGEHARFPNKLS